MDSVKAGPPTASTIRIGEGQYTGPSVSLIVDSLLVGSISQAFSLRQPPEFTIDADDIESIAVYKGQDAIGRGGCPGTSLVVITTKSLKWRPPAGTVTGERSCTPARS